jgi:hypothetical protein
MRKTGVVQMILAVGDDPSKTQVLAVTLAGLGLGGAWFALTVFAIAPALTSS